jgi:hypothetical protein
MVQMKGLTRVVDCKRGGEGVCTAQERRTWGPDLVVRCSEATADVLIVQYLNLESEVLLKIFDDHDQKRQLDAESLLRVGRARDEVGAHLSARVRNSDNK